MQGFSPSQAKRPGPERCGAVDGTRLGGGDLYPRRAVAAVALALCGRPASLAALRDHLGLLRPEARREAERFREGLCE